MDPHVASALFLSVHRKLDCQASQTACAEPISRKTDHQPANTMATHSAAAASGVSPAFLPFAPLPPPTHNPRPTTPLSFSLCFFVVVNGDVNTQTPKKTHTIPHTRAGGFLRRSGLWLRSGAGRAQLATSRLTGPVLAASSTSEMLCRPQWSRSGLSECNHVTVAGHHLIPV